MSIEDTEDLSKIEDQKISFLYKAIDDAQAVIRMVDAKAGAVIAFWTVIMTIISKLGCEVIVLNTWNSFDLIGILIILFLGVIMLKSIYLALMTVLPLNAPALHINNGTFNPTKAKETFYLWSMNPSKMTGSLLYFNSKKPKLGLSRSDYEEILNQINSRKAIINELSYELMKVSFIRNIKLSRINNSLQSILYFFLAVLFFILYFLSNKFFVVGGISVPNFNVDTNFFIIAYVAHLLADYLFQTDKQAMEKSSNINYLLIHSFIYSIIVSGFLFIILGTGSLNTFIVLLISHIVLDNRKFIIFWCQFVKRIKNPQNSNVFIMTQVDQTFHILVLFLLSLTKQ